MKSHIAEYVSPGHPDRLADAIVESIVDLAVGRDGEALVGVECAVHTDHVFIDGRIAAGKGKCAVSDDERAIRSLSDDQNVVTGFACNHPETDYLPPAHFMTNYIGRKVDGWRRTVSDKFGPDFKVLVHIEDNGGRYEWRRLTISIQHREGVFAAEQHELVLPVVSGALAELEARGLAGISNLSLDNFILNGMGDFIVGGPEGDNGLSGKKLAIDFYGPEIPIGGGAICGKDPHKVDVAGAFRARELARRLLKECGGSAVTVRLGWTPGDAVPAFREAESVDSLGLTHPIPASALPPEDWFSIDSIVADLRLTALARRESVLDGYFLDSMAPDGE